VLAPETENLSLWTVGHIDELLVPPPVTNSTADTAQDEAVITHLHSTSVLIKSLNKMVDRKIGT